MHLGTPAQDVLCPVPSLSEQDVLRPEFAIKANSGLSEERDMHIGT